MSYYDDHEEEVWCDMENSDDCERMDFYLSDKFKEVFGDRESVFTESDESGNSDKNQRNVWKHTDCAMYTER